MSGRILDALPDAALVLAADGTILDVGDRCRVVLGFGPDAVGEHVDERLDLRGDAGGRIHLPPSRSRVADRSAECAARVVDGSGRERAVVFTGRWSGTTWIGAFRSAARRDRLDRVGGDVVATVSHEIRSPLASVKGFARTLIARWDRFSDEQKLTMLRTIDADADRVTRLLTDLLEVSRIDAGRVHLARADLDLGALAASVADKARHRAPGTDRELVVEIAPDTPSVFADADRVEQVLTNLVDNAVEHGRSGRVQVTVGPDARGVRVRVRDEGPGVGEAMRGEIFRKFGRGRSERRSGTGLGLYIGRGLAEAHGGRLDLVDSDGPGACFELWLPGPGEDPAA